MQRHRLGLTLIELLVVLAVIGLLMAIALPAMNTVIYGGRRSVCQSNLKQLGIAIRAYHASHDTLPPGLVFTNPDLLGSLDGMLAVATPQNFGFRQSGIVSLLPYFEGGTYMNMYNADLPWWQQPPELASARVPTLECPQSDPSRIADPKWAMLPGPLQAGSSLAVFAPVHYALNKGVYDGWCVPALAQWQWKLGLLPSASVSNLTYPADERGPFDINSAVRLDEIRDGLSKTFLAGEAASGPRWTLCRMEQFESATVPNTPCASAIAPDGSPYRAQMPWIVGAVPSRSDDQAGLVATTPLASTAYSLNHAPIVRSLIDADLFNLSRQSLTTLADCRSTAVGPTEPGGDPQLGQARRMNGARSGRTSGFRSNHVGGGNFLMGDGSVNFITEDIHWLIYRNLSTIAGGELADIPN